MSLLYKLQGQLIFDVYKDQAQKNFIFVHDIKSLYLALMLNLTIDLNLILTAIDLKR